MTYNCFDSPSLTNIIRKTPPPLLIPTTSTNSLKLSNQVPFASTSNLPYVLHVIPLNSSNYLLAGSDDTVKVFAANTLDVLVTLPCKQKGITSLIKGSGDDSEAVFITSRDGVVTGWDARDFTKEAFRFKGKLRSYIHSNSFLLLFVVVFLFFFLDTEYFSIIVNFS